LNAPCESESREKLSSFRKQLPPLVPTPLLKLQSRVKRATIFLQCWLQANSFAPRWLPKPLRHPASSYVAPFLLESLAVFGSVMLLHWCPEFAFKSLLPVLGVILVALSWGAWPGLLAMLFGAVLLDYFVLPPAIAWENGGGNDTVSLLLFLAVGIITCIMAGQNHWARRQSDEMTRSLREAQVKTERERLRLRTLLDFLPAAVGMVDAQGQFVERTPACKALWGEKAPVPHNISDYQFAKAWWPDTEQPLEVKDWGMTHALTNGEVVANKEVEIETADGERKVVHDSAAPIRDETGTIVGAVGILKDVTELKRLEQALRRSEREAAARASQLQAVFEAMTECVVVFDRNERILQRNAADREAFVFDVEPETLGKRREIIRLRDKHNQPIPQNRLHTLRALQGEVVNDPDAPDVLVTTSRGPRRLNVTSAPIYDAEGRIVGGVMVMRDVSERRNLEREMAERAAQLETIFESITDGLIVTDQEGRVIRMNQAIKSMLHIEDDPTGKSMQSLEKQSGFFVRDMSSRLFSDAERPISRYLQGETLEKQESVDLILRTRDGQETLLNNTGAPILDSAGQIIGTVEVVRDVTERRNLEAQTRHTLNALLGMAEALVQVHEEARQDHLHTKRMAIQGKNPVLPIITQRLAELTQKVLGCQYVGMAAVEPETDTLTPIAVVGLSPEHEQQWWTNWDATLSLKQQFPPPLVAALHAGKPILLDNTQLPLPFWQKAAPEQMSMIVPMHVGETLVGMLRVDCAGGPETFACADKQALTTAVARLGALVLERERLLRERAKAQASALAFSEANARMDTFLGMAGHELKTPLTSIKLSMQLAERRVQQLSQHEPDIAKKLAPFLEQSLRADGHVERLERLINDLLDVSRIRAGKLELRLEPIDLAAIVREAVEEQYQATPARSLLIQFPSTLSIPVIADGDRISQVVTNYLTNALKYSPEERPVEVGIATEDHHARVWVRDQGPGLPLEEQEHIWERFHRVKGIEVQSGSGIGLGLGLHICQTIIERHQGSVGVKSAPGQGSIFWFTVPVTAEQQTRK
jgi:PAS domain S-box-containing protein